MAAVRYLGTPLCTQVPPRDAILWPPALGGSELLKQPSTPSPPHSPFFTHIYLLFASDYCRCQRYIRKHMRPTSNDLKQSQHYPHHLQLHFARVWNPTKSSIKQGPSFVVAERNPTSRPDPKPAQAIYFWTWPLPFPHFSDFPHDPQAVGPSTRLGRPFFRRLDRSANTFVPSRLPANEFLTRRAKHTTHTADCQDG